MRKAYIASIAAIAAATPTLPHLTVYPPPLPDSHTGTALLCQTDVPVAHACAAGLKPSPLVRTLAWPWESLRVTSVSLIDILSLPDPTGGQYEIEVRYLSTPTDKVSGEHALSSALSIGCNALSFAQP